MGKRIFISYQHQDLQKAKGFNLLRWNKNVELEFVGRHLLSPVDSNDPDYITRKIQEQLKGSSVTVVLLGDQTDKSDWVEKEIKLSLEKGNGIVGIKVSNGAQVPDLLNDCGAEILDWQPHEFQAAIDRAFEAAGRGKAIGSGGNYGDSSCGR
jgi:hypothetical protein